MFQVHPLPQRLLDHIRRNELLSAGERVGIAVSGGIDSVVLLRLMLELRQELGIVLSVVHFNHMLRGPESEADQKFVAGLAQEHGLEFHCSSGDVAELAAEQHSGIEAAAREMRYEFFRELLMGNTEEGSEDEPQGLKPEFSPSLTGAAESRALSNHISPVDKIATGHTLDDQAETVLMRIIRGTGMRGLGGIYPRVVVEDEDGGSSGEIVRPLLSIRRRELEQYLKDIGQPWREDSTNSEAKFTRNRVRQLVLPLLEREFNPAIVENLSEFAEIARDEEDYWENEVSGWLGTVVQASEPQSQLIQILTSAQEPVDETPRDADEEVGHRAVLPAGSAAARDDNSFGNISLSRPWLLTETRAVQRRVVKAIGAQAGIPLEFKHVEEILRFAAEDNFVGKELSLPLGWKVSCQPEALVFLPPNLTRDQQYFDYEYALSIPGRVGVPELGVVIDALRLAPAAELAGYNPQQLLRADFLPAQLLIRNWRPGDRFWPAHTKAPKKVKELLQDRHIAQTERKLWPVALSGDEIVWMRGFPVPAKLQAKKDQEAILIRETPVDDGPMF